MMRPSSVPPMLRMMRKRLRTLQTNRPMMSPSAKQANPQADQFSSDEPAPSSTKKQSEPLLNTLEDHPDEDDLIASIDGLFVHADKETVTVKDIVVARS
ncbi:hypothetical protein MHU86_11658 [Fragilaria crotonensis]|nr:hypothetical protein MHU86_11658 [Fragilaria crotonensis]